MNGGGPASPPAKEAAVVLNFGCPHCGMALSVPAAMAGIDGPCPGCGSNIQAPPAVREAVPIEIKPRPSVSKSRRSGEEPVAGGKAEASGASGDSSPELPLPGAPLPALDAVIEPKADSADSTDPGAIPPRKVKHRHRPGRALDPHTGLSGAYNDELDTKVIVKIAVAFLLTALIVLGVFAFLKKEFFRADPAPLFEEEYTL